MTDYTLDPYSKVAFWQRMSEEECGSFKISQNKSYNVARQDKYDGLKWTHTYEQVEESLSESQNFCLKVTQESYIPDTCDITTDNPKGDNEQDIVVISDSSSGSSSPRYFNQQKSKFKKNLNSAAKVYVLDTTDSDCSNNENGEILRPRQTIKNDDMMKSKVEDLNGMKKKNSFYTSDESSNSDSESFRAYKNSSRTVTKKRVNSTLLPQNKHKDEINSPLCQNSPVSKQTGRLLNQNNGFRKNCNANIKFKLNKNDAHNIIKNIKSTRAVYESPRKWEENNVIINESTDDVIHPAFSPKYDKTEKKEITNESTTNSETDIIEGTQMNLKASCNTNINRRLDKLKTDKDEAKMYTDLSERKKNEISEWIKTYSPDSKSDTSFSNIVESNRNSVSSGNSSLERLEMNYETPNNRGKVPRSILNEEREAILNCDKVIDSTVSRQATLHEFVGKSKNDVSGYRTPRTKCTSNNEGSTLSVNTPQDVNIMDCADILDKLYGNTWRTKPDVLFPTSEPRKQIIGMKDRAVQTEKKATGVGKFRAVDSEDDSSSDTRNKKPQQSTLQKKGKKNIRWRDSFINDQTSSESGSDSLYYTALTNPRASTNSESTKQTKTNAVSKRFIAICDTDTEDEDHKRNTDHVTNIRGRRLSFSNGEDEDEDSNTSEFDPGDDVPLKPSVRKEPIKKPSSLNTNTRVKSFVKNKNYEKTSTFLASLSESVPMVNAHPDAKKYRTDYKNNKEDLCKYLFQLYNNKVFDQKLPKDMSMEWNVRMRGTAGFCYNKKSLKTLGGVVKSSRIVLSTKVLDTPDRLRDTLIHEMCHAAAWLINDVSDGHGPFWTGWANKAMKTFPELPQIRRCHDYKIKTKFTYKCTGCGYSIGRHSKSLDVEKKRCGHCYGKFELLINKTTKSGTVQMQTPKREPSGFALYVKENYSTLKKERNIKHAEVMKILGQQFSAVKIAKKNDNIIVKDTETPAQSTS